MFITRNHGVFFNPPVPLPDLAEAKTAGGYNSHNFSVTLQR